MNRFLREFRLIPIVLVAVGCLFALKAMGIAFDGGYVFRGRGDMPIVATLSSGPTTTLASPSAPLNPAAAASSPMKGWMQETFFPEVTGSVKTPTPRVATQERDKDAAIVTGSAAPPPKPAEPAAEKPGPKNPPPDPGGTKVNLEQKIVSPSERAILERLQDRRNELDARARELEMRENLLKSAEKKLETQSAEQKAAVEAKGSAKNKDEVAETRFKSVVTMYETMKPKEAAKIFDRLDIRVLIEVASQMKPQIMAAVLAQMSPEAAEKLTVEMATRAGDRPSNEANLPKIEGKSAN
ncbi:MAG: flagellar protein FlbB [Pseudomonadota bacterium]